MKMFSIAYWMVTLLLKKQIDQAHEQNNKLVKIDGGAIGILENQNALLKWAVAGPINQ